MSVTLKKSGTVAVSGGTDQVLTKTAQVVTGGTQLADFSQADFRIREQVILRAKMPSLQSDGSYSKGKMSAQIVVPIILASGKTVNNVGRIEMELHPEFSGSNSIELRNRVAQLAINAALANFWLGGDMSI